MSATGNEHRPLHVECGELDGGVAWAGGHMALPSGERPGLEVKLSKPVDLTGDGLNPRQHRTWNTAPETLSQKYKTKSFQIFLEQISLTVVTKHPHYISMKYNVHIKEYVYKHFNIF